MSKNLNSSASSELKLETVPGHGVSTQERRHHFIFGTPVYLGRLITGETSYRNGTTTMWTSACLEQTIISRSYHFVHIRLFQHQLTAINLQTHKTTSLVPS